MAKQEIQDWMSAHKVTVESAFVPWSQSRNKDEKDERGNPRRSLNWRVTVKRDGRNVITTDYSAGVAHCPAYKWKLSGGIQAGHPYRNRHYINGLRAEMIELETEKGVKARRLSEHSPAHATREKLEPDACDVLSSLVLDSSVLDSTGFEDWAGEFGYDPDSRKAEALYRACTEIALKFRNGLGAEAFAALQTACEDY